jgi:hypothetical protein
MKYSFVLIISLIIFGFFNSAYAQLSQTTEASLNIEMVPQNPGPNQLVSVSVVSYSTDINAANISWIVNGKTEKSGRGEKLFTFKVGDIDTTTTLVVRVNTNEGDYIEKVFQIKPAGVDLTWESKSYVPPFYKGKAMFTYQSPITFIAIPHLTNSAGQEISAKNLIYKWIKNGSVMDTESGYGKNTFTMIGPLIARTIDMRVEVTSPTNSTVGIGMIKIDPINPSVIFYKKNPIYGIEFQSALSGTVEMNDSKEISIFGAPYFFGVTKADDSPLSYKWAINGTAIEGNQGGPIQVFRQKEGVSGISNISLSIENTVKILQVASNNFNLKFGAPTAETNVVSF